MSIGHAIADGMRSAGPGALRLLEEGLREIHRSLSDGGKFFATTFKKGAYGVPRQVNDQGGASFRFFDVDELDGLLRDAGFSQVSVELVGQGCLIARCIK